VTWEAVSGPKTKFLPSSADTWSFQLIVDTFPLGIRAGKAAESLSVVILGVVGILGSEPTLSFSLSPEEDEDKASGEGFLEVKKAETLLEERLAI